MYSGEYARTRADQPAFIMAQTGEAVTHAQLEARSNRLAHFLRSIGLKRSDHYSIFMEDNAHHVECCAAGERKRRLHRVTFPRAFCSPRVPTD